MANIEGGGVMGHIALSKEPPTEIKYGFDLELRKNTKSRKNQPDNNGSEMSGKEIIIQ